MRTLRPTRRSVLAGLTAVAGVGLPRPVRAAASQRRFLFVQAFGGWDITRAFVPIFGSADIEMEDEAQLGSAHGIDFVDHPDRPAVTAFFEAWGDRTALVQGLYTASIAHPTAIRYVLTGGLETDQPDWATLLAADQADDFVLPHLVVGGTTFGGYAGVHVGRAGGRGQLQGLADGTAAATAEQAVSLPAAETSALVDNWLEAEIAAALAHPPTAAHAAWLADHARAVSRAREIGRMADSLDLAEGDSVPAQALSAIAAFRLGVARCATLAHPTRDAQVAWDSHALSDQFQTALYESLFTDLDEVLTLLAAEPGAAGGSMLDETVIVVTSELARTPRFNGSGGKDHWPCTAALIIGAGVDGGRMIGAFDDQLMGQAVDLATGELDEGGSLINVGSLGATVLALGDLDPASVGVTAAPITGVLS